MVGTVTNKGKGLLLLIMGVPNSPKNFQILNPNVNYWYLRLITTPEILNSTEKN